MTCRVLKLSRQPYYRWLADPITSSEVVEAYRANALFDAHRDDPEFGHRLLADEARDAGESMSDRTAWRIASTNGWWSAFGKKRGKGRRPGPPVHDDLCAVIDEDGRTRHVFAADAPNELWLVDITEHKTSEGKLYLCAIKDVYSGRIVGYSIDSRMKSRLAVQALENAAQMRGDVAGCIVHSDRGSQGGLNWSSQHLDRGGVQDGNGRLEQEDQRCSGEAAPAVARGPGLASGDALPGAAGSVAGGATPVLAHDRNRRHDSGSVVSDRRVGPGRHPLVSSRWRHAPDLTGRAHRPISVVRGA